MASSYQARALSAEAARPSTAGFERASSVALPPNSLPKTELSATSLHAVSLSAGPSLPQSLPTIVTCSGQAAQQGMLDPFSLFTAVSADATPTTQRASGRASAMPFESGVEGVASPAARPLPTLRSQLSADLALAAAEAAAELESMGCCGDSSALVKHGPVGNCACCARARVTCGAPAHGSPTGDLLLFTQGGSQLASPFRSSGEPGSGQQIQP